MRLVYHNQEHTRMENWIARRILPNNHDTQTHKWKDEFSHNTKKKTPITTSNLRPCTIFSQTFHLNQRFLPLSPLRNIDQNHGVRIAPRHLSLVPILDVHNCDLPVFSSRFIQPDDIAKFCVTPIWINDLCYLISVPHLRNEERESIPLRDHLLSFHPQSPIYGIYRRFSL